jgi:hypothetical protein
MNPISGTVHPAFGCDSGAFGCIHGGESYSGAMYSDRELAAVAVALGHEHPTVIQTRRGNWRFNCSCGVDSPAFADQAKATSYGIRHFRSATRAAVEANGGVSLGEMLSRISSARLSA